MSASPHAELASVYSASAERINAVTVPPVPGSFKVQSATAMESLTEALAQHLQTTASTVESISGIAAGQADSDEELTRAPSPAQVKKAMATAQLAVMKKSPEAQLRLRDAEELQSRRASAVAAHGASAAAAAEAFNAVSLPDLHHSAGGDWGALPGGGPGIEPDVFAHVADPPNHAAPPSSDFGPGSDFGSAPGGGDPSTMPGTELSSDVNPNALTGPSALTSASPGGQPGMPTMPQQGAGQGAGAGGSGSGTPFTTPPGMLNPSGGSPGARLPKDKKKKDPTTELSAAGLGAVGGAAAAASVDRGGSVTGVHTAARIGGRGIDLSTQPNASGVNPNAAPKGTAPMGGGRAGMMPMGGAGNNTNSGRGFDKSKQGPAHFQSEELLGGRETYERSADGGIIGRSAATEEIFEERAGSYVKIDDDDIAKRRGGFKQ